MELNDFSDLKEEIKNEDERGVGKKIVAALVLLCLLVGMPIVILGYRGEDRTLSTDTNQTDTTRHTTDDDTAPKGVPPSESIEQTGQKQVEHVQQPTPTNVPQSTPSTNDTRPFDQAAFTATGRNVVAHYNDIVGLVTFGPSASHEQKVSAIQRAYALDRQYFAESTNLRRIVSQADSAPEKYVNLMNLAESGVAAISTGIDEMYRWSTGSSVSSVESGGIMVGRGSDSLLQFSRQL